MLRDSLTGLPNRLSLSPKRSRRSARPPRPSIEHAVLVVDMLRFSRINESMGALAGDELLITFARRLILALRAGDVLARTGGNEFGILVSLRRGVEDALTRCRADPGGDDRAVQADRARNPRRMRDRRGVDARRPGSPRNCSATPSSRSSRPSTPAARRSMSRTRRPRRGAASRSKPSFAGRSRKTSSKLFYQPLIDLKTGAVVGVRGAGALDP